MIYLELDDLLATAETYLGRPAEVSDWGLLQSAVERPKATVFGEDAYPDIHHKAAAFMQSLISNRALVDGNKRLGWPAAYLLYAFNGYGSSIEDDRHFDLVLGIATHQVEFDTVPKIAHELAALFSRL